MSNFNIERYDVPKDFDEFESMFTGGSIGADKWTYQLPNLYRILNDPAGAHRFVKPDSHMGIYGYWFPLLFLLVKSFGWRYPARGLKWWADYQYPISDARLAVIYEIWVKDGDFDLFRKWIEGFTNVLADGSYSDYRDPLLSRRVKLRMRKIEELKRENPECEARARIVRDGTDPLHLRDHLFDDYSLSFSSEVDAAKNQVEVHLKQHLFSGHPSVYFFSALNEIKREYASRFLRQLPSYDVDFEEIGYLGSYRISPMTGLWYTGSHYLHLVGSVQNDDDLIEAPVNMWSLDPLDPPHM